MKTDEEILNYWFEKRSLSQKSRELYSNKKVLKLLEKKLKNCMMKQIKRKKTA